VKAVARVVAEADTGGRTRLTRLRSEAPLVLRETADALYLVGGAGGPLAGDDLELEVEVGPRATLTVRTAAASVALGGGMPSHLQIRVRVAAGGELRWLPEPVVAAQGCDHRMDATVDVAADGRVTWREEILLGRHGEPSGSVTTRLTADAGGAPLVRHELALGPGAPYSGGPAVVGSARAVGTLLIVDPGSGAGQPRVRTLGPNAVAMALDGPGIQVVVLDADAMVLRRNLDNAVAQLTSCAPVPTRLR
jgi:urease accessory protein